MDGLATVPVSTTASSESESDWLRTEQGDGSKSLCRTNFLLLNTLDIAVHVLYYNSVYLAQSSVEGKYSYTEWYKVLKYILVVYSTLLSFFTRARSTRIALCTTPCLLQQVSSSTKQQCNLPV